MLRLLSIDGGGIRGIVPAVVLAELERRAGRPAAELFDMVAGTSTGGILACALTIPGRDGRPRYGAAEVAELYEREGPRIFRRSPWRRVRTAGGLLDEHYASDGLAGALRDHFGDARLSEALVDTLVTAYELEQRRPHIFKSWREGADDVLMREVAHATSAAPTYFEPLLIERAGERRALVDGGVFAANPAMCAYAEAARHAPGREVLMVSLGTGQLTRPIRYEEARDWGQLEWVRPLIDVIFDGVADAVDYQLGHILGERYHRLQTRLDLASDDLDDASRANMRALRAQGERLVAEHDAELDEIAAELAA